MKKPNLQAAAREERLGRSRISKYRTLVQGSFLLLVLFLGFRFWQFVRHYESGGSSPYVPHSPGVEAFLPIGGLTSLKYWIGTGEVHPLHPAALFLFLAAITVSVVLKKSFCGWICPVGFVSEWIYRPWKKIFGKNVQLPRWLDYPLRSLKYLVLGFFIWAVLYDMSVPAAAEFLNGDYWKVSDVKMLKFFTDISKTALIVTSVIALLSIPIRNVWCRFLCPYGALLGLAGLLSPGAITRDEDSCTHCRKCTRNCPAYLPVEASRRVLSPECTSCLTCVSGCPVGALSFATPKRLPARFVISGRAGWPGWIFAVLIPVLFFGIVGLAKITGNWQSRISDDDLKRLVPQVGDLGHPR
ncbi:MAG: hypothetical protein A2X94_09090 [Bdellovibrionales bacterium GWB1_55_8]|nr:MAG: hypothetical protein A2X94_09090 [Bdellovibrionales bacterium GWB1_55_8]